MTAANASPWWYRRRGAVFGLIYFAGFFFGSLLWGLTGAPYVAFYEWLGQRFGGGGPAVVLAVATLLVFLCWAVRVWGSSYLSAAIVWNADASDDALLVDGPFRYVRNPLYAGNLLMAVGIGTLSTPYGFAMLVLLNVAFVIALMRHEAILMRARYGAAYEAFAHAVPALIPRLTPARIEGSVRTDSSLLQGLRSEVFTASLALGMLCVVAALPDALAWFFGFYVLGFVGQVLAVRSKAKR